jgi:nitroimidazol reductase NimA-like FMN-containing flavoprotein (pyridoxamine 5'-phosphate oxidase superfamily)
MMSSRMRNHEGGQGALKDRPGQEPAAEGGTRGRKLRVLGPEECLDLLESVGVGRVGLMSADGIVMLPVNYVVAAKSVVFRTAPDTLLAALAGAPASFEADHLDEASQEGWSVLVQGHAHKVAAERDVRGLEHGTRLEPWAVGARDVWVRITPARITGRRIQQA